MQDNLNDFYKYCIPIYLNQPIVFDLLAMLEGGFTSLSKIKVSSKETETNNSSLDGSFGFSNVFAFLDVKLGGAKRKGMENEDKKEVSEERIHTPSSLFAKLRQLLNEQQLIRNITSLDDIDDLESGEFVEFRAVLKENPIVEMFKSINSATDLMSLFGEFAQQSPALIPNQNPALIPNENSINFTSKNNSSRNKKVEPKNDKKIAASPKNAVVDKVNKLTEDLLKDLTKNNSVELIGDILGAPGLHALLSSKTDFFVDKNAAEIIDGEFKVLGKVVRVVKNYNEDSINLLRKTSFGALNNQMIDTFLLCFNSDTMVGLRVPEVISEVKGPAIQVVPISIFT